MYCTRLRDFPAFYENTGSIHHERREDVSTSQLAQIMGSCSALHSKLMQFHSTEKYCDVQVRVQDKSFPCHRVVLAAASEYFDALFGGSFMEKDARETTVHDIDVETFQEILTCVYTAEMCEITASNVLNLLSASVFLRIHSLEEASIGYIRNNVRSLQNLVQILVLARSLNMTTLINFITKHVIQNFELFYYDPTLLEMTFDDLSFLIDQWSKSKLPFKYEDLLLQFLIRWVYHASEERRVYFIKLIAAVDFERISPNHVTFMTQYFKDLLDQPDLKGMPPLNLPCVIEKSSSTSHFRVANRRWIDTEDSKKRLCLKRKLSECLADNGKLSAIRGEEIPAPFHDPAIYKNVLGLHVYVEYTSTNCNHKSVMRSEGIKVLSSNERYPDWFVSCETDAWRSCSDRRTIVQESTNLLYCMEIFQDGYNPTDFRQTFCSYSSIDLKLASSVLAFPPVPLEKGSFNMCATNENIFLSTFAGKVRDVEFWANAQFSVEDIYRGFYQYNCEVDKWFPAPRMKIRQNFPTLCADHNLIYSIGGTSNHSDHSGIFQAFDYRSRKWMVLPKCISGHYGNWSNSCVLQNKVFVTNKSDYTHSYDTIAGKWELNCGPKVCGGLCKMVPYDNKLWLLCKSLNDNVDPQYHYSFETYIPSNQEWHHYKGFNDVISRRKPSRTEGIFDFEYEWNIKDVITFKT